MKTYQIEKLRKELRKTASKDQAVVLQGFFKTGPGEYGEGDIFIGVKVPEIRKVAKEYLDIGLKEIKHLLSSDVHEERLTALLIMVLKFRISGEKEKQKLFKTYTKNLRYINNWDLVDLTAPKIVGEYLLDKDRSILYDLACSSDLWERRISMISTFRFIKERDFSDALSISGILLSDTEDLIHKAVGWMLREIGKRDINAEEKFLKKHYLKMPRTMLRYAIEKFPKKKRQNYLKSRI